jgi:glycosyltransferase involved in cell wall biosynthesis
VKVSVVIPAYNAERFLPETLRSVFEQSTPPDEVIVVDDGSSDGTGAVARSFGATVIALSNGGVSAARNAGSRAARGEYIAFLDADDLWTPDKLRVQLDALDTLGQPAFSFTDYRMFDENGLRKCESQLLHHAAFRRVAGKIAGRRDILIATRGKRPVLYESYIPPSAVMVRRADLIAAGGFDETLVAAEDYELFLRLLRSVPAVAVMEPLLLYRQHARQATANATEMKAGIFEVARRVAAAPDRYPPGDAAYLARTGYLRHYRLGVQQARLGFFNDAIVSFGRSFSERPTLGAGAAYTAARLFGSGPGRAAFAFVRGLWKKRPGRR